MLLNYFGINSGDSIILIATLLPSLLYALFVNRVEKLQLQILIHDVLEAIPRPVFHESLYAEATKPFVWRFQVHLATALPETSICEQMVLHLFRGLLLEDGWNLHLDLRSDLDAVGLFWEDVYLLEGVGSDSTLYFILHFFRAETSFVDAFGES